MRRKSSATTRTKLTQPILRVLFRASFLSFSQCRFSFRFQFRFLNRFPEARVRKFLLSGLRRVRGVVARLLQLSPLVLLSERDRFGIFFWETGGEAVAHLFVFFSSSNIRGGNIRAFLCRSVCLCSTLMLKLSFLLHPRRPKMLIFPPLFSTESSETVSVVFVVFNDAGLACVVLVRWRASGLEEEGLW